MANVIALKLSDQDNVATVFANDVKAGTVVDVKDKKGQIELVTLKEDIPYGHKLAIMPITTGDPIVKYGEEIGVATKEIAQGEYVHVHNLNSQRGRGDLNNK